MRLTLEVIDGPSHSRRMLIESGRTVKVGRTRQADFPLPEDMLLSRLHFAIECESETCRLRDLGSTNGTHLNGLRVGTSGPLKHGDEIHAGQTTFRVNIGASVGPVP